MSGQQIRHSILQVIDRLQANSWSYPDDSAIADQLKLNVEEVRGHLGILEHEGRIKLKKTQWGHSAGLDPTLRQLFRESLGNESDGSPMQGMPLDLHEPTRVSVHTYGNMEGRDGKPLAGYFAESRRKVMAQQHVHVDPEFETFTYGDPTTPKRSLRYLKVGDLLVFYCGLQEWDTESGWNGDRRPGRLFGLALSTWER